MKGFDASQRQAVIDGLQSELTRVLSDPATRAQWAVARRTPVLRLGRMPLEPGINGSRKFGTGIAAGIGRGMRP